MKTQASTPMELGTKSIGRSAHTPKGGRSRINPRSSPLILKERCNPATKCFNYKSYNIQISPRLPPKSDDFARSLLLPSKNQTIRGGLECVLPLKERNKLLKNNLLGILYNDNLDKTCVSDLNALFSDASSFKHWALQMLDATGKIYPGLLNGNINLIGDYEECLAINESKNGRRISGKYCTLALTMGNSGISPLATSLKQGPSSKQSHLQP
ncbi:hypothetical protein Zmor_017813 [Zophobas morio]|uniref:Nose resistant-to-fluoxetine protein N-terminal domain-containing protein n=1 Tax=Zophobas morio TaxID=2755281 RepID=A0AA38MCZ8_9CUCU|nr:hypothetical protein Zmor_017813 [Zophobas morio]